MNEKQIEEIKERLARATQGPWVSFIESREKFSGSDFIRTAGEDIYLIGATAADQDFIANARQDVPLLIEELARLQNALAERDAK